ncbi:hypothetical protein PACTADRAFT_36906 [Pachysolen tannophilus NRRL Y-2460]|uniref:Trehalase n=1 Tax=Pachysolen tannophilus NRRL Y-2460 TaxID=669874 RepID=A0A1E4U2I7_PACTA|nr:hypothetical protein PACTADRAFT_36906 [Pachysolen tannophilus NRRL Y-2460]
MKKKKRNSSVGSDDIDPYSDPDIYYGPKTNPTLATKDSKIGRTRTLSTVEQAFNKNFLRDEFQTSLTRRASYDDNSQQNRRFFISDIDATLKELLESEDSDKNYQITIEDTGPKVLKLGTLNSNGYNQADIRGTYMLSNLLQELTIAKRFGRDQMILDEARLNETPVKRLRRLIVTQFWNSLTRRLDDTNIGVMAKDTKIHSEDAKYPRIYIPYTEKEQYDYFCNVRDLNPQLHLDVQYLPKEITPEWVQSVNTRPGLLALAMDKQIDKITGESYLTAFPYVVPGGRFNELYGWDSYMILLGLLVDNRIDLGRGIVEHFIFEIKHYGKILNANRSYYLCRTQPPFLTDAAIKIFEAMGGKSNEVAYDLLQRAFKAAIKEYKTVWLSEPRYDPKSGLSCYHAMGKGIPPETEATHFTTLLTPYAQKYGVSFEEFQKLYNDGKIHEPKLDEYFIHDRSVRESGHDTSYRLEGRSANLATIDLNSLLYKYEKDISFIIKNFFNDEFVSYDGTMEKSAYWDAKAIKRKEAVDKYCWNEHEGMYFDYDIKLEKQSSYETVTTLWPMWSQMASKHQAELLVKKALPKFEELGGLVAGTESSRGIVNLQRPSRQWDYPYGWAPHQMLAWVGLENYGYKNVAKRICYRWLYLITKAFVDYNGIVVEKYDVTKGTDPHKVDAEYGNQGADFKGVATEGFGWVNASFILGLTYCDNLAIRNLDSVTPPHDFFQQLKPEERKEYGL